MSGDSGPDGAAAGDGLHDRRRPEWDVRSAPRNYASLVSAQVVNSALAFTAIWMVTRLIGKEGYGALVAVLAAGQCVGQIAVQWSAPSLVRFGCEEFVETGRVARAFWTRLKVLGAAFVVMILTAPWWFPPLARVLHLAPEARLPVVAFVITTGFWVHVQFALQSAKLLRLQARLLIGERVAVVAGVAALGLAGVARPGTIAFVYVLTPFMASLGGVWAIRHLLRYQHELPRSRWREMLQFSLPFLPASIVGYFTTNYFDAFFITYYRSTADLGQYTLVFQIAGMAMQLPLLAGSVALPLFITLSVSGAEAKLRRYFDDVLPLATLAWSVLCAIAAAVGAVLVPIVFGAQFSRPGELIWPLMSAAAFASPCLMAYIPLGSTRSKTYVNMVSSVVTASINTGLNVLLIPRWGLPGCAWATTASYGASLIVWVALADERPVARRVMVVAATLPVTFGAVVAANGGSVFAALAVAVGAGALMAVTRRRHVGAAVMLLRSHA